MKRITTIILALLLLLPLAVSADSQSGSEHFTDISADAWYAKYIDVCYDSALMNGVDEGIFDPDGTVTVAQALTACARIHHVLSGGDGNIPELPEGGIPALVWFENAAGDRLATLADVTLVPHASFKEYSFSITFKESLPEGTDELTLFVHSGAEEGYPCVKSVEDGQTKWSVSFKVLVSDDIFNDDGSISEGAFILENSRDFNKILSASSLAEEVSEHSWFDKYFWYFMSMPDRKNTDAIIEDMAQISARYPQLEHYNVGMGSDCPREFFALFLYMSIPDENLVPINSVSEIPDMDSEYLFSLYNAGILGGSDENGTFFPESTLKRAELAAVISRVVAPELRLSLDF